MGRTVDPVTTHPHLAAAALVGGLSGPILFCCADEVRNAALTAVGRELAAAEYLHRSALDGDAVALRYLPESRRRLCTALLRMRPLGCDAEELVPIPFGRPVPLRSVYDALPRLRVASRPAGSGEGSNRPRAPDPAGAAAANRGPPRRRNTGP